MEDCVVEFTSWVDEWAYIDVECDVLDFTDECVELLCCVCVHEVPLRYARVVVFMRFYVRLMAVSCIFANFADYKKCLRK